MITGRGQLGLARKPVSMSTRASATFSGGVKSSAGWPFITSRMRAIQIGRAALAPVSSGPSERTRS